MLSASLRALHSFPTRRSSDLVADLRRAGAEAAVARAQLAGELDRPDVHRLTLASRSRGTGPVEDRKSTRLNSSHMSISYAVFFLKKKNTLGTLSRRSARRLDS